MNVKTYVTTNKWIFSIIKKSEESKKLDARVRKNKGKEERKKKKEKNRGKCANSSQNIWL